MPCNNIYVPAGGKKKRKERNPGRVVRVQRAHCLKDFVNHCNLDQTVLFQNSKY